MDCKIDFFWENDDFPDFLRWLIRPEMGYTKEMIIDVVDKPHHFEGRYKQFQEEKYNDLYDRKNKQEEDKPGLVYLFTRSPSSPIDGSPGILRKQEVQNG